MNKEAIIVGGGPAGLSAALGLIQSGVSVTVLEKESEWKGRVCGAFLNAEAVSHLKWLRVWDDILEHGAIPVKTALLQTHKGFTASVKTLQHRETAYGLPREDLETVLRITLIRRGGTLLNGTRAIGIQKLGENWFVDVKRTDPLPTDEGIPSHANEYQTTKRFRGDLVILADGRFSLQSKQSNRVRAGWYGWNSCFDFVDQKPGDLSLHFFQGGYLGLLTFSNGETNLCGLQFRSAGQTLNWNDVFERAQNSHPSVLHLLRHAKRLKTWQGVGPLPFSKTMNKSLGSILVGDAAAVGDPFAGEGLGRALSAGPMLFKAVSLIRKHSFIAKDIERHYNQLWKKSYEKRLLLGSISRLALKNASLSSLSIKVLFNSTFLSHQILKSFHQGFRESPKDDLAQITSSR